MSEDRGRGRFVWYDLMTRDAEGAVPFYKAVVGWGTEPWEGEQPYTMWTGPRGPLGGVMDMADVAPDEAAPHWLGYLGTDDVDATTARARELGATVLAGPQDIPSVGRYALVRDPQGAVVAFFSGEGDTPSDEGPFQSGDFSWHELATTDPDGAWRFYSELFGWEETGTFDMGEMGMYRMWGSPGGEPMGAVFKKPPEMPGPSAWLFYAQVDDVNSATESVKRSGGQVLNGPMEVPGGDWIVQCMDPGGAAFALHQKAAPA